MGAPPREFPWAAPLACWEFQSPESLCADRKELGSQSPEFPWHEDEDEDDEEEWEPAPQDCDLQAVCDSETWKEKVGT